MKKISIYILITLILIPVSSKAVDTYTLLEPLPCIAGATNCTSGSTTPTMDLQGYIGYVFKFAIAAAAFLAVVMITYGGFEYMLAESITNKSDARKKFQNAAVGLLMALASYLILRTIDPRLVAINTTLPPVVVDLTGIQNYEKQQAADLSSLSSDARTQADALVADNKTKQARIDELNTKAISDDLTDEEITELTTLEQQVKTNNSAIATDVAGAKGAENYRVIESTLAEESNYQQVRGVNPVYGGDAGGIAGVDLNDSNKAIMNKSKQGISSAYEEEELNTNGDYEGEQKLEDQKQFYLNQVDEEYNFRKELYGYNQNAVSLKTMKTSVTNYQNTLNDLNSPNPSSDSGINIIKNDPELKAAYTSTLNTRIGLLNASINKK